MSTYWSQTCAYDRWGNRAVTASTIPLNALTPTSTGHFDATTNRIAITGMPWEYDTAGNQTRDGLNRSFTYDAENRQTAFDSTATYAYDGEGRRVSKTVGGSTSIYVYDAFGRMVGEYGISLPLGITYLTPDHLGSTRTLTDHRAPDDGVTGRIDYQPFGEQILASIGGRVGLGGYGSDGGARHKFTGKERDLETNPGPDQPGQLDYFEARYYSGAQGRFTGVDPIAETSSNIDDPRRWNGYAYANNSPLRFFDPDGRQSFEANYEYLMYLRENAGGLRSGAISQAQFDRGVTSQAKAYGAFGVLTGAMYAATYGSALLTEMIIAAPRLQALGQDIVETYAGGPPTAFNPIRAAQAFGLRGIEGSGGMLMGRLANGAEVGASFARSGNSLLVDVMAAYNPGRGDALGTLRAIQAGALSAARAEGLESVTLSGVAVVNSRLAPILQRAGFTLTTRMIDGREYVAFSRTIHVY